MTLHRVFLLTLVVAAPAAAQTPRQLIERGRAHIENIQGDSAHRVLVAALARQMPSADRLRGFTLLGIAELLRGNRVAARTAFEQALAIDASLRVDSLADLQDDVRSVFVEARNIVAAAAPQGAPVAPIRTPPVLTVYVAADTLVAVDNPRLVIGVQPNARARVISTIAAADAPSRVIWSDTQSVAARQSIMWLLRRDGNLLPAGRYVLRSQATDSAGLASPVVERRLTVSRARPDTQTHPAPLAASAFLPEAGPGQATSRDRKTLLSGGAIALLIAATPMILGESTLNDGVSMDPTAPVVAGGVAVASVIGFLKSGGPKASPVFAENARKNRELRDNDRRQREAIARSNAAAIDRAAIRVVVEP